MTSAMAVPRRGGSRFAGLLHLRRASRPTLSWVILTATALIIATVLLVWLLLWLNRPRSAIKGWWLPVRGLTLPVIGHQSADLDRIVKATGGTDQITYQSIAPVLRQELSRSQTRPAVLYLSAPGVADDRGAYLLRPESGALAPTRAGSDALSVETLVELLAAAPSRPRLLILDAGQVGSNRNLGVYANAFLHRLKSALEAKPVKGLVILSSCAPGQVSWASEADGASVFGFYVAKGLSGSAAGWDSSGRGVTVRGLYNYVRERVKTWVALNRQAEQTPEWLGDPDLNFALPRTKLTEGGTPSEAAEEASTHLNEGWSRRDALQKRLPFRHTPLAWRQYLGMLLHAERLVRAGDYAEAETVLASLDGFEKRIASADTGTPVEKFWSLGLLQRYADDDPDHAKTYSAEGTAANQRIDQALTELVSGDETAEAPVEMETKPAPAEPPAESAKSGAKEKAAAPPKENKENKEKKSDAKAPNTEASSKSASRRSPQGKRKKDAAVSTLILSADDVYPQYVEAQILVWADTFGKRGSTPDAFKGARGELLSDALRTRRLAEKAAAADERIGRWIAPLVEAGDALRRRAQDAIFAGDSGRSEAVARQLGEARERYRNALDVADHATRALDLVEQIEAEAEYYGEWLAHRPRGQEIELDRSFVDLLKQAAALARLVQVGVPGTAASARTGESGGRDPLAEHLAGIQKWEIAARDVKTAFDRLRDEFQRHCAGLAASGGASRWREIDAALRVPLLDAETRRQLFQAVRSPTVAGTLSGPEVSEQPSQNAKTGDAIAGNANDRTARRDEGSGGNSAADPEFWKLAIRLAQIELSLLELGGASESELAGLAAAAGTARDSIQGAPDRAFESFARLADQIRVARADRLRAILQERGRGFAVLADADRGLRVMILADALGLSDKMVDALDRYHRQTLLVWHGTRLLDDFAPAHARRLFDEARQISESEALQAALERASAMDRAKIELKPEPAEPLVVSSWTERPLALSLSANGRLPEGDATLLIGFDPTQPVSISEKTSRANAREGALVPVGAEHRAERREYLVGRTESTPEPVSLRLKPVAFYRGQVFTAERGVEVTLNRAEDPVSVTIQQSYEGLKFRDFGDQFKEHPGQGYLHFGSDLRYKLVVKADRAMKVVVRYGLKEHVDSFKTKTLEIGPKKTGEIIDVVRGNDFPIVKGEEQLLVSPLNLTVTVWKDREGGELQGRAKYLFRMIPPAQYISTAAEYDPSLRMLYVWVTHLANDPVTGPVTVTASVGGGEIRAVLRRSRIAPFEFQIPPTVKAVTWRVGVETMPNVFRETVETPPPPSAAPPGQPPPQ